MENFVGGRVNVFANIMRWMGSHLPVIYIKNTVSPVVRLTYVLTIQQHSGLNKQIESY